MKKIKLEAMWLINYLPNKLEVVEIKTKQTHVLYAITNNNNVLIGTEKDNRLLPISDIKPMLRPTSDIGHFINVAGQKFVPLNELEKIAVPKGISGTKSL